MKSLLIPDNEEARLNDLRSYQILDTLEEKDYNELTELAAQICNCPTGLITFVDKDRQWFKAKTNFADTETSREVSFCAHAILQEEVMVVSDARVDERFEDNILVTGELGIVFYAGAPIISMAGHALGTICVIDKKLNQSFGKQQQKALKIIASQIGRLLELRLKNRVIVERSEMLIASEKKISQFALTHYEKEKSNIAYELHENFAQTLAGVKLYLDFADTSKDPDGFFVKKSKQVIDDLIRDAKALTRSIVPTTLENDNYLEIINEMADKFGRDNKIFIKVIYDKDVCSLRADMGLTIFRIVENQLKISKGEGAKSIIVEIKNAKGLSILFTDDGNTSEVHSLENDFLYNNNITRTETLNGRLIKGKSYAGRNVLEVAIP